MSEFAWTDETCAQLRELWAEEHSASEIARRMGIGKNAVVGKSHRLKLPPRPSPIQPAGAWSDDETALVRTMAERGNTVTEIAAHFGLSKETARMRMRKLGLQTVVQERAADKARRFVPNVVARAVIRAPVVRVAPPPPQPVYAGRISECTYIVSGERRSAVYCDLPTMPNRSYCQEHHGRCCTPITPRPVTNPRDNPTFVRSATNDGGGSVIHPGTFEEMVADAA